MGRCRLCKEADAALPLGHVFLDRYAFNIIFNLINKSTLNTFPCPWFIGTWQLGECCTTRTTPSGV